jgi:hypothetical protein
MSAVPATDAPPGGIFARKYPANDLGESILTSPIVFYPESNGTLCGWSPLELQPDTIYPPKQFKQLSFNPCFE